MKKDLKEKMGAMFGSVDENLLMMSREMGDSDITNNSADDEQGIDSIFNIIYGFTMNAGMF